MTTAFSQGQLQGYEAGCAARGAQGCPSEQGPCTPGGCVPGRDSAACQGQCSACLGSSPWRCGEKLWVEGETTIRAGSFCCQEGAAWLRAAHSCTSPPQHWQRQLFKSTSRQGLPGRKGAFQGLCFRFPAVAGGGIAMQLSGLGKRRRLLGHSTDRSVGL